MATIDLAHSTLVRGVLEFIVNFMATTYDRYMVFAIPRATMKTSAYFFCFLIFVHAACTTLPDIAGESCGNGVIDVREDCEGTSTPLISAAGRALDCGGGGDDNACFFVCRAADDVPNCPIGWGCGDDDRCRPPGGMMVPVPSAVGRLMPEFDLGDVDGDHIPDILGLAGQALSVRYGDGVGGFSEGVDHAIPAASGPVRFTRFNGDMLLDVLAPASLGFFMLTGTEERTLDPYNYNPFTLPNVTKGHVISLEAYLGDDEEPDIDREHLLMLELQIGPIALSYMNFIESDAGFDDNALGLNQAVDQLVGEVPVGDLNSDGIDEFALVFRRGDTVFLYTAEGREEQENPEDDLRPKKYDAIPSQSGAHKAKLPDGYEIAEMGALFLDVDSDNHLDLVVGAEHPIDGNRVLVWLNQGNGQFDPDPIQPPVFCDRYGELQAMCPEAPWPLAAADLDGDGITDYVFRDEITLSTDLDGDGIADYVIPFVTPNDDNDWYRVSLLDINNDGAVDIATSSASTPGLYLFINAEPSGLPGLFNPFYIHSSRPPIFFRPGDYNGDLIYDLAFTTEDERGESELFVVFGGTAGTLEAVAMGTLGQVSTVARTSLVFDDSTFDGISDFVVLSAPLEEQATANPFLRLSVFFGSSSRRLVSPFVLPFGSYTPIAIVNGQFSNPFTFEGPGSNDPASDIDDIMDMALILVPDDDLDDPDANVDLLALAHGVDKTGDVGFVSNKLLELPPRAAFDATCALWTAGDIDPAIESVVVDTAAPHELIGIDNGAGCNGQGAARLLIARDIRSHVPEENPSEEETEVLPYEQAMPMPVTMVTDWDTSAYAVRRIQLADLDNDGRLDVLLLFRGLEQNGAISILWNRDNCANGERFCAEHATALVADAGPLAGLTEIFDVAAVNLNEDTTPELVVLGAKSVRGLSLDESGQYGDRMSLIADGATDDIADERSRLRVADVDRDGLVDLVFSRNERLQVFTQARGSTVGERYEQQSLPEPNSIGE